MTAFEHVASGDVAALLSNQDKVQQNDLLLFLPFLVGLIIDEPNTVPSEHVNQLLSGFPKTNSVFAYYKINHTKVRAFTQELVATRSKVNAQETQQEDITAIHFEQGDEDKRMRLVLSEIVRLVFHVKSFPHEKFTSDILDNLVYQEELSFILPVARKYDDFGVPSVQVALALATCLHGQLLLQSLVLNYPPFLYDIVNPLLDAFLLHKEIIVSNPSLKATKSSSTTFVENFSATMLFFSSLSYPVASYVRQLLLSRNIFPNAILTITTKYLLDTCTFLSSIILPNNPSTFSWLKDYIENSSGEQELTELRKSLRTSLSRAQPQRIASHFKLYAALTGLLGLKLGEEEAELVLSIVTAAHKSNTTIQVSGLCLLLVWEGLLSSNMPNVKQSVSTILNQIIRGDNSNDGLAQGLVVLLSAHFQTHSPTQVSHVHSPMQAVHASVAGVVRSILGLPVAIHGESLNQFAPVFSDPLLLPVSLAFQLAERFSYITNPQTHMLCLSAVHQILQAAVLSSSILLTANVDLTMWMWSLINQLTVESKSVCLPPLLPSIISHVVEVTKLISTNKSTSRVPESQISSKLAVSPGEVGPIQVLTLYYVLLCNEEAAKARNTSSIPVNSPILKSSTTTPNIPEYSNEMLSTTPVRAIISHMHSHDGVYAVIYPSLMALAVSHFPQLFDTPSLLIPHALQSIFDPVPLRLHLSQNNDASTPLSQVESVFKSVSGASLLMLQKLEVLDRLRPNAMLQYSSAIVDVLLPTLVKQLQRDEWETRASVYGGGVAAATHALWFKLFQVTPWAIALRTVHALWSLNESGTNGPNPRGKLMGKPSHVDLVADPLLVLRVDRCVWKLPVLTQILLQILSSYMAASRRAIQSRSLAPTSSTGVNDMEWTALMLAQDSGAIQILIEAIQMAAEHDLPNLKPRTKANGTASPTKPLWNGKEAENFGARPSPTKGMATEVITSICMFIHQMFIAQPLLAKLVHFQGYPHSLLSLTVAHVPSMHVCLEFLPELLAHSHQPDKLLFAINLAAYLVEKYPLPHTLPIAKRALQLLPHLYTLYSTVQVNLGGPDFNMLLNVENIVENVGRICAAFPVLADDALGILLDMASTSKSREEIVQIQLATKALKSAVGMST